MLPQFQAIGPLFMDGFFDILVTPAYAGDINTDITIQFVPDTLAATEDEVIHLHRAEEIVSDEVAIPFGIYGVGVMYNMCGKVSCGYSTLPNLILTPDLIADVLSGTISTWNDPSLVALNPEYSVVSENIIVYVASEESTDIIALNNILRETIPDFQINHDVVATVDHSLVKVNVYALPFTFAVIALVQTDLEGTTHIADVKNTYGTVVSPNMMSLEACANGDIIDCYSLSDVLFLSTPREYVGDCGSDGLPRQKVALVQWLLSSSAFISTYGIYPLSVADSAELESSLNKVTCNGVSLLAVYEDNNAVSKTLVVAIRVVAGVILFLLLCAGFGTYYFRASKAICNSQPEFMGVIICGLILMSLSLFFMGVEDVSESDNIAPPDDACMEQVWLYVVGFSIVISALVAKASRIKRILHNAVNLKREKVQVVHMLPLFFSLVSIEILVMIIWQIVSPLHFERTIDDRDHATGLVTVSHGVCTSEDALPFLFVILIVKAVVCMYGNVIAFQINQPGNSIGESRILSMTMLSCIQSFIVAVPLCYLLKDDPSVLFVVKALSVVFAIIVVGGVMVFSKFFELGQVVRRKRIHGDGDGKSVDNSRNSSNPDSSVGSIVKDEPASVPSNNLANTVTKYVPTPIQEEEDCAVGNI